MPQRQNFVTLKAPTSNRRANFPQIKQDNFRLRQGNLRRFRNEKVSFQVHELHAI